MDNLSASSHFTRVTQYSRASNVVRSIYYYRRAAKHAIKTNGTVTFAVRTKTANPNSLTFRYYVTALCRRNVYERPVF